MSKVKDTLATLLVGLGIHSEEMAAEYVRVLDDEAAQNLLSVLQEKTVGITKNLEEGKGGFLAGLLRVVESHQVEHKASLPSNPKKLDKGQKLEAIKKYDEQLAKSNSELVEGLRLLLSAKRAERRSDLSTWSVELSDPDFPMAVANLDQKAKAEDEKLVKQVEKTLDKARADAKAVAKKHKNQK